MQPPLQSVYSCLNEDVEVSLSDYKVSSSCAQAHEGLIKMFLSQLDIFILFSKDKLWRMDDGTFVAFCSSIFLRT